MDVYRITHHRAVQIFKHVNNISEQSFTDLFVCNINVYWHDKARLPTMSFIYHIRTLKVPPTWELTYGTVHLYILAVFKTFNSFKKAVLHKQLICMQCHLSQ